MCIVRISLRSRKVDCVTIWLINSPDPSLIRTAGGEGRSGTNHGNYRITTASLYPLTLSYPKDIIQGMFGFDGRVSGPCLWFSIAKLLLSAGRQKIPTPAKK